MKYAFSSFVVLCMVLAVSLASAAGLTIKTASLPAATANSSYSATLAVTGGVAPYIWTASRVPAGLTLSTAGVLSGNPATAGTFAIQFTAKDAKNKTASKTLSLVVKAAVPAPTLTSSVPSPQNCGHVVTFTAGVSNSSDQYEYQFMYVDPVYPTLLLTAQSYSGTNTWSMNTSNNPYRPGVYSVTVYIRKIGSTATYDYSKTLSFTVIPPPPATGATLSTSLASPQMSGRHITLTAGVSNPDPAYYCYQYKLTSPDGTEKLLMDYGNSNSQYLWNTFGLAAGDYTITVNARQYYSTAAYESTKQIKYTLTPSSVVLPTSDPLKYGRVLYEKGTTANPAGSYYVFSDTGLAKFDADWNQIWSIPGIVGSATATFDKDGNIAGTFATPNVAGTYFKRIDPSGNVLSSVKLTLPSGMTSAISKFDDAGNIYYAWVTYVAGTGATAHALKLDNAGNQLWSWQAAAEYVVQPTGMSNGPMITISGLAIGANGRIYVSGTGTTSNVKLDGIVGGFLITFDTIGNKLASIPVANAGGRLVSDGQDGFVTIGGETAMPGLNAAMDITHIDQNGAILWQKQLFPAMPGFSIIIRDYVRDATGNVYILTSPILPETPTVIANDYTGIAVTKLDANGDKLWVVTGGMTLEEPIYPLGLSLDDAGNLYVKTYSQLPTSTYKALVKFGTNGKQEWLK